ncbi:MAG: NAD(P)H-dependent oxidoreductase [Umezawaea sp.]
MTTPLRLAIIASSTRDGRFGPTVASWFTDLARLRADLDVAVVDLAETPLPATMSGTPSAEDAALLGAVTPTLEAADAFVVVTPEYNHSYPASLKNAIDWHFTPWRAKPVGFVSYGGVSGGLRAVEHLRQVFAELHAVTIRDTVSFHGAGALFDGDGKPKEPEGCGRAADVLLDQLVWWGDALRAARAKNPYAA